MQAKSLQNVVNPGSVAIIHYSFIFLDRHFPCRLLPMLMVQPLDFHRMHKTVFPSFYHVHWPKNYPLHRLRPKNYRSQWRPLYLQQNCRRTDCRRSAPSGFCTWRTFFEWNTPRPQWMILRNAVETHACDVIGIHICTYINIYSRHLPIIRT